MTTRDCMAWRTLLPAIGIFILGVAAVAQHQPIITTIDAPLAGAANGYGTQVQEVGPSGIIAGFYVAYDNLAHGFLRFPDGHFAVINGPGVPSSLPDSNDPFTPPVTWANTNLSGTYVTNVDAVGNSAGYYVDASGAAHGFLRTANGRFTSFDVKDAGNQANQGTYAVNMNPEGTIAGYYVDSQNGWHGFVRDRNGVITEFDAPDGTGSTWTGWTACLNERGEVAGAYYDSNGNERGFVRKPDGKFETFAYSAPGMAPLTPWTSQGTNIWAINADGATTGVFVDANNVNHGLVRYPDGKLVMFDVPRAPKGGDTIPQAINSEGAIVGLYNDAPDNNPARGHHGFVRSADGRRIVYFDVPVQYPEYLHGTVPYFLNEDTITGFYVDGTEGTYVWNGFERKGADWNGPDWR